MYLEEVGQFDHLKGTIFLTCICKDLDRCTLISISKYGNSGLNILQLSKPFGSIKTTTTTTTTSATTATAAKTNNTLLGHSSKTYKVDSQSNLLHRWLA